MNELLRQVTTEFVEGRPRLMAFIYGLIRDTHKSEDIYQEVWVRLANEMEKGVVIGHPERWCRQVAKNLILQHWREEQSARVVIDSDLIEFLDLVERAYDEDESPENRGSDRQHALNTCVEALPAKSKQLLLLKYEEGYSLSSIAIHLQQSKPAIIKALLRLRQSLAICVEKKMKLMELGL